MSNEHDGYGVSAETFQEIIRERKAEKNRKAEEKRLEVLSSIQDRKSKTGIDPLDQFPKEVWEMVLEKLEEPKDFGNVSQVHDVFDDLLELRRARDILFPQVVGLSFQKNPRPYRKDVPLARDVKMRALSKSMMNGVDRWHEDNLLQYLRTGMNVDVDEMPTIFLDLEDFKVVKGLLKNFLVSSPEESYAKRFLLRSIQTFATAFYPEGTVQDEEKQRFQEKWAHFRNDIRSLLEVIGDQVWHFAYIVGNIDSLENGGITFPQIYDTLLEWVQLMPNLKWIEINVGEGWRRPEQRKGFSIKSHLENDPFPKLEHLKRLDIELNSTSVEAFEIYEAIFSVNRHLRRLQIEGFNDELLEQLPNATLQQMDSLEALSIGRYQSDHYFNWRLICPFITSKWHLKQIQLNIGLETVELTDVFQVLGNFPTLEHVSLDIQEIQVTGDMNFLELPNLTEFKLTFDPIIDFQSGSIVQFFFSLQFLLYCKNLKRLRWENTNFVLEHRKLKRFMTNRECHERMINFRGGYRNLNYSNIWDVFPYLESIEVYLVEYNPEHFSESGRRMKFKRVERDLLN